MEHKGSIGIFVGSVDGKVHLVVFYHDSETPLPHNTIADCNKECVTLSVPLNAEECTKTATELLKKRDDTYEAKSTSV